MVVVLLTRSSSWTSDGGKRQRAPLSAENARPRAGHAGAVHPSFPPATSISYLYASLQLVFRLTRSMNLNHLLGLKSGIPTALTYPDVNKHSGYYPWQY